MKTLCRVLSLMALLGGLAAAQAPLPAKIIAAKSIFLVVDTDMSDFHRDVLYKELQKWGRWQIADEPENADLIFTMTNRDAGSMIMSTSSASALGVASGNVATGQATGFGLGIPIQMHSYYLHVTEKPGAMPLWTTNTGEKFLKSGEAKTLVKNLKKRFAIEAKRKKKVN